jgi:hypothetical protein
MRERLATIAAYVIAALLLLAVAAFAFLRSSSTP